ncbi:hypothetical protein K1719_006661 [Acacia pycnantha]|nr:hypothetical protein K1719_006661 [Acacia pycnantha]
MEDIIQDQVVMVACKDEAQIMKGKRTKRHRAPSPLRLAIAMPCTTATSNDELRDSTPSSKAEEEDMANCLILLAHGGKSSHPTVGVPNKDGAYLYQCKTCDRGFPSFRALGGHRARHKKMKTNPEHGYGDDYCTSTTLSLQLSSSRHSLYSANKSSSKVHECSICGAEFSSGQALGGHMRRHRTLVNAPATTAIISRSPESQDVKKTRNVFKLDLNLPAPDDVFLWIS